MSIDTTLIQPKLKKLRLPGIIEVLEERLKEATKERWSYSQFLDLLLSDEIDKRDQRLSKKQLSQSGLDMTKTLETFDFSFNPKVNEEQIREIATMSFMEKGDNIFLLGPAGVGKSHLAQALGHESCRKKNAAYFFRTTALLKWIHGGRGDGSLVRRLEKIAKCPLLILDDFGLQPLNSQQQDDLYEIICRRYESASTIITSNRDIGEWISMFSNSLIGSAAVDRLVHKAVTLVIEGKSFRLTEYRQKNEEK